MGTRCLNTQRDAQFKNDFEFSVCPTSYNSEDSTFINSEIIVEQIAPGGTHAVPSGCQEARVDAAQVANGRRPGNS